MTGGWVSFTVTVKLQEAGLLTASATVQVTVVTPFGKLEPVAGEQLGVPMPEQLSVAVAFAYVTSAAHCPGSVAFTMFAAQVNVGGVLSITVTICEADAVLPKASVAV
jgi:hypothetical protein